jgi:hypothetical protein
MEEPAMWTSRQSEGWNAVSRINHRVSEVMGEAI